MFNIKDLLRNGKKIDLEKLEALEKEKLLELAKANNIGTAPGAEKPAVIEAIKKFVEQQEQQKQPDNGQDTAGGNGAELFDTGKKTTPDEGRTFEKDTVFVCVQDCFLKGALYRRGDELAGRRCPPHFAVKPRGPEKGKE